MNILIYPGRGVNDMVDFPKQLPGHQVFVGYQIADAMATVYGQHQQKTPIDVIVFNGQLEEEDHRKVLSNFTQDHGVKNYFVLDQQSEGDEIKETCLKTMHIVRSWDELNTELDKP